MSNFKECPFCGAALDAGETCDCRSRLPEMKRIRSPFEIRSGARVSAEEFNGFLAKYTIASTSRKNYIQFETETSFGEKPRYPTFVKLGNTNFWQAFGACVAGGLNRDTL